MLWQSAAPGSAHTRFLQKLAAVLSWERPLILSPEQATGDAVDGRSDLFAVGTLLYESITGRTPFGGNSFIEIAANVLHFEPKPPSRLNSLVPRELDLYYYESAGKETSQALSVGQRTDQ